MVLPLRSARSMSHCFISGVVRKIVFGCEFMPFSLSVWQDAMRVWQAREDGSREVWQVAIEIVMTERSVQSRDKFIIRLPDGMRERINAAAQANKRSMTAEIVDRLEKSLSGQATNGEKPKEPTDLILQLERVARMQEEDRWRLEQVIGFLATNTEFKIKRPK